MNAGDGNAAGRLESLVNSASAIEELVEGAAIARKAETLDLIGSRIAALRDAQRPAPATGPNRAASGRALLKEDNTIEVAAGSGTDEAVLRLKPGSGQTESFSDCTACPEMVALPAGQIVIGSRPEEAGFRAEEAPAHKVSIRKPFAVSKHGISAENWRACVDAGVCRPTLSSFLSVGPGVPATRVSWFEAKAYVQWLSHRTGRRYRLLSEAEWEYAARASAGSASGPVALKPESALPGAPAGLGLLRNGGIGGRLANASPNAWGLKALPGSVLEWVEDCWHVNYAQSPSDGSPWLSASGGDCAYRAVRGVAASDGQFGGRRPSARAREFADARSPALGFRVARELHEPARTALKPASGSGEKAAHGNESGR
jgi:formylglycine-generating enzyme required for sulfatase activity